MYRHTTFRVGGPAQYYVTVVTTEELQETIRLCNRCGMPWMIFGNGSNVLVSAVEGKQNEHADRYVENKEDDFILVNGNTYYLFCDKLPMSADPNVALKIQNAERFQEVFKLDKKIKKITWLDNGEEPEYEQDGDKVIVKTKPYMYGRQLVVRVAKIEVE